MKAHSITATLTTIVALTDLAGLFDTRAAAALLDGRHAASGQRVRHCGTTHGHLTSELIHRLTERTD